MKRFISGVASLGIVIHLHRLFSGKMRNAIDILFVPIYLICYPFIKLFSNKDRKEYPYNLGVCGIIKNEAPYIKEWIDYYRLLGVDVFYIYDNDSDDQTLDVLSPYIKKGIVKYRKIHGKGRQLDAYTLCCKKHKKECRYIAFYDIDEFVYLCPDLKLIDVIEKEFAKHQDMASLALNWIIFGSSNLKTKDERLVIERFMYRSKPGFEKNHHIKSIVNPRKVVVFRNPHYPHLNKGYFSYNIFGNKVIGPFTSEISLDVRINHYFCKSLEEYTIKKTKGFADKIGQRAMSDFTDHDQNDVYDDGMKPYIKLLK